MPDFDFDELDKAVAGALQPDAPAEKPNDTAIAPSTTSEASKVEVSVESSRPTAPAARRSSGRFMDVVHPSSAMRGRTPSGQLLDRKEASVGFTPPVTAPVTSPVKTPTNEPVDASEPLESPFLPGAKVEKRPLGAFTATESSSTPDEDDTEELKLEAPDEPRLEAHTLPDPIDFAAQSAALGSETEDTGLEPTPESTPIEVTDDVAAHEEDEPKSEPEAPVLDDVSLALEEPPVEPFPKLDEVRIEPDTRPSPVETVNGPTSITQQYEEKPSTEQTSGAIYDTETYHKPLAHSAPKQGGVWTIIWIILLVILGAGAGVAFYLFVLPML